MDGYISLDIDMALFRYDRETDTEIFGWYKNNYIAIKK